MFQRLEEIQREMNELKNQVSHLKNDVIRLDTENKTLKIQMDTVSIRVGALKGEMMKLNVNQEGLAKIQQAMQFQLNAHESRIKLNEVEVGRIGSELNNCFMIWIVWDYPNKIWSN